MSAGPRRRKARARVSMRRVPGGSVRKGRAAAGRPNGGGVRPFGYRLDALKDGGTGNYVIVEEEAEVLRGVVAGLLEGRSLNSMVRELNARGVTTTQGKRWRSPSLARIVRNPVVSGMRVHKGVTTPGTWPAIISATDQSLASRILTSNFKGSPPKGGAPGKYLLSGLMKCAHCAAPLYFAGSGGGTYVCSVSGGGQGCVRIKAALAERYVWATYVGLEEHPRRRQGKTLASEEARMLTNDRLAAFDRRDLLAEKLGVGLIDDRAYGVAVRALDEKIARLEAKLSALPVPTQPGFRKLFGTDMTLEEKREALAGASITVGKGRGEDRISVEWPP
jgi:Recombinase/Recombinase zinc beta ribbon domain